MNGILEEESSVEVTSHKKALGRGRDAKTKQNCCKSLIMKPPVFHRNHSRSEEGPKITGAPVVSVSCDKLFKRDGKHFIQDPSKLP